MIIMVPDPEFTDPEFTNNNGERKEMEFSCIIIGTLFSTTIAFALFWKIFKLFYDKYLVGIKNGDSYAVIVLLVLIPLVGFCAFITNLNSFGKDAILIRNIGISALFHTIICMFFATSIYLKKVSQLKILSLLTLIIASIAFLITGLSFIFIFCSYFT